MIKQDSKYATRGAIILGLVFVVPMLVGKLAGWDNETTGLVFLPLLLIWKLLGYEYVQDFPLFQILVSSKDPVYEFAGTLFIVAFYALLGGVIGYLYSKLRKPKASA